MATDTLVSSAQAISTATGQPNVLWSIVSAANALSMTSVSQPHQQLVTGEIGKTTVLYDTFTP